MTEQRIGLGDVVRFRAGGPDMVAHAPDRDHWWCSWFGDEAVLQHSKFPEVALDLVRRNDKTPIPISINEASTFVVDGTKMRVGRIVTGGRLTGKFADVLLYEVQDDRFPFTDPEPMVAEPDGEDADRYKGEGICEPEPASLGAEHDEVSVTKTRTAEGDLTVCYHGPLRALIAAGVVRPDVEPEQIRVRLSFETPDPAEIAEHIREYMARIRARFQTD